MPDWDEDSPELRKNLAAVMADIADRASLRDVPSCLDAARWHLRIMNGLEVPHPRLVGKFRGAPELDSVEVQVAGHPGVKASEVRQELVTFESKLRQSVSALDAAVRPGRQLTTDLLAAVLDLCSWVHAEWVRIHPFANGNGRTARLWANYIALRYGLPPFVRLRPRPDLGYGTAGAKAMQGDWRPTTAVFRKLLDECLNEKP